MVHKLAPCRTSCHTSCTHAMHMSCTPVTDSHAMHMSCTLSPTQAVTCAPPVGQEWWGVTDIVKQQAQMIAAKGFRVLIPDLYKGVIGVDREEAGHVSEHREGRGRGASCGVWMGVHPAGSA